MPERIQGGGILAAIGAVMLLVSLFLDWFSPASDAWQSFEIVDLLLAGLAIAALATGLTGRALPGPVSLSWLGVAALVLVVAAILNHPPAASAHSLKAGAWVGFGGAALIALGGLLDTTRISVVIAFRSREEPEGDDEEPEGVSSEFLAEAEPFERTEGDESETATMPPVARRQR